MSAYDVSLLDDNFNLLARTSNYVSLVWHERLYDDWKIQFYSTERYNGIRYIYNHHLQKLGVIQIIKEVDDREYSYVGTDLAVLLADSVISATNNYYNMTITAIAKSLVDKYELYGINTNRVVDITKGSTVTLQVTGDNLREYTRELLRADGLYDTLEFDYASNSLVYTIKGAEDKRSSHPPLSWEWGNITAKTIEFDDRTYRNYAYVAGEEKEGKERVIVEVDARSSVTERKKELWVDARDLQSEEKLDDGTTVTIPAADYRKMLYERGVQKLAPSGVQLTVTVDGTGDFQLGDLRLLKIGGIVITMQVSEVVYGYEQGTVFQTAKFEQYEKEE